MLTQIWINNVQLADGVTALVSPVRMPGKNASRQVIPLRAPGVANYDRVTKVYTVEFYITRQHASDIAAAQFRASHNANDIANVGDLVMEWISGTQTLTGTIAGAAWQDVDPELIGAISTRTAYRVTGGPIVVLLTDSSAPGNLETESGLNIETESGTPLAP